MRRSCAAAAAQEKRADLEGSALELLRIGAVLSLHRERDLALQILECAAGVCLAAEKAH